MLTPRRSAETMLCWGQGHVQHLCWIFNDQAFLIANWRTVKHIYRLRQVTHSLGATVRHDSSNGLNFSCSCTWMHQYSVGVWMCSNRGGPPTMHSKWSLWSLWSSALNMATIPPTGLITTKIQVSAFRWEVELHSNPAIDTLSLPRIHFNVIELWPAKWRDPTMSRRWEK